MGFCTNRQPILRQNCLSGTQDEQTELGLEEGEELQQTSEDPEMGKNWVPSQC